MTFLNQSRKVYTDAGRWPELADRCWPEILAVVEAARNQEEYQRVDVLDDALDDLDKKAGEG